jgi:hypothetical protein
MGEYIPGAPVNDEARKCNQNLPGMGGVFNYVNLHVYHYGGNNPVKYTDPDEKTPRWLARLLIRIGIRLFGGPVTKAIYKDSLHGNLPKEIIATPKNDTYSLSSTLMKESSNISINTPTGEQNLIKQISDELDIGISEESGTGNIGGNISSLKNVIGGIEKLNWKATKDENGVVNVTISIEDQFNFEEKAKGKRSSIGELFTKWGRHGGLQESLIKASFDLKFKKNPEGKYEKME